MGSITIQKNGGNEVVPTPTREWDPLRTMREMMRWDPFREIAPLWPAEERMASYMPAFEIKETKGEYLFKADMPGVKEKDLEVTLTGNRLTVSGKREAEQQEKGDTYFVYERTYGSFSRSFTLPEGAEAASLRAELKDGVLAITVPKKPEVQARKVPVASGEAKPKG